MEFGYDRNFITADSAILSYIHNCESVDIPGTVNGFTITRIGNGAFAGCKELKHISVPEGIREIGHKAFAGCKKLNYVSLPQSLESIETDAFDCTDLLSVDFWLKIPYSKYVTVREGSIKLADGRHIVDPGAFGGKTVDLIRSFIPKATGGRHLPDKRMGCVYEAGRNEEYVFADYDGDNNGFLSERTTDQWLGRCIDMADTHRNRDRFLKTALLFCVKEGSICDSDINLQFTLKQGSYFFIRSMKIRWGNADYYLNSREYLTSDETYPFYRETPYQVLDSKGNLINGTKLDHDIRQKMILFN